MSELQRAIQCPLCHRILITVGAKKVTLPRVLPDKTVEDTPKPGDYAVCQGCGTICRFSDKLNLVEADLNDLLDAGEEGRRVLGKMQDDARRPK